MDGEDVFQRDSAPPRQTKRSILHNQYAQRVLYFMRMPYRSPVVGVFTAFVGLAIVEYVGIRLIYGKEHPVNRFTWRRMERRGELPPELLEKKRIIDEYTMQAINKINIFEINWTNKGDKLPDGTSFGRTNFD